MDKAGNLIARGIGAAIPGGNFLLGMVDKLDRFDDLSAQDKAFAEMQMGINEQSMYGGNLPNQDRYGYNKRSMLGNYANVVAERVAIAKKREDDNLPLRPIDNYYLQKQKVPHYRLSERHLIQTFSKYSCSESFDNENAREEWFKTTPTKAEKYFLEVTNTIEEYVHSYCIKEVNKIRE